MTATALKVKEVKRLTKKQVTQEVGRLIAGPLDEYKTMLGGKKFASKVNKASKLFADDLTKVLRKEAKATLKKTPS